jgi:hypothetical protein
MFCAENVKQIFSLFMLNLKNWISYIRLNYDIGNIATQQYKPLM